MKLCHLIIGQRVFRKAVIAMLVGQMAWHVSAGDAVQGKLKSVSCWGCHDQSGISANPAFPNLAGQKPVYLMKALQDYKQGKRSDGMMNSAAARLSDEDIADIAAYYSQISN
ncbi:c-type cytochrome [Aliamphritea hakodatensis]|uniref:c-type cytochrome n=1 Tax=Aliamphritea hakodatensis TaxID=2895352 RepID=UPI0022FDA7B0|nr:cytochrome c [Aliamphritea hakodatensis]